MASYSRKRSLNLKNIRFDYGDLALFIKVGLSIGVALFLISSVATAKSLKLGLTVPPTHVWYKVTDRFSKNLELESQGRLKIKLSPLSQLGNEPQMINLLQSGAIAMSVLPAGVLSNREASLLGWFLPYLFENVQQAGSAADLPAGRKVLENLESHGLIGLGYTFAGMRHVLSVKPINSPRDLVNQKIRAFPSPIFNDWWKANGAAPTALPLGEIAPSLSTSLLDAVDIDLDIVVGLKFYQQAGNLALTNHMAFPGVLVASKKWWSTLSSEDQTLISKLFDEATKWGVQSQSQTDENNLDLLKNAGVNITTIDLSSFRAVGVQISEQYIEQNDIIREFTNQVKQIGTPPEI